MPPLRHEVRQLKWRNLASHGLGTAQLGRGLVALRTLIVTVMTDDYRFQQGGVVARRTPPAVVSATRRMVRIAVVLAPVRGLCLGAFAVLD